MTVTQRHGKTWRILGLCLVLLFPLSAGVVEAKKEKPGKCEGTKKQRKQKMDEREITEQQLADMIAQYKQEILADYEQMKQTVFRRLETEYEEHKTTGAPFVYDILILSGGGAKGAFGSGFLEGWGTVTSSGFERPEFDMVTGVSTGALIAPFAFIGTDEAYASVVDFYANPDPNWVRKRKGIAYLPSRVSMMNTCHLQDTIRENVDQSIVEAIAGGAAEDRLLLIGVTNLDVGAGRAFDLGRETERALQSRDFDRIHSILLASSAIPGAFPPIEMDGMYYADGGAASNLFIATFPGPDGPVARFKAKHPEAPLPKVRVWAVVNQQLKPQHAVTRPRWISISGRALSTLTSSSQLFALAWIKDMARQARVERGLDAELYLVSIPNDAPEKSTKGMFDQEHMRALQELGRKMGADPSSWQTEVPDAYTVEGDWLASE
jgi:predicted acylesterase/phospholipase RssA